jgi:tetratricopeptide (TPR) repeat protein
MYYKAISVYKIHLVLLCFLFVSCNNSEEHFGQLLQQFDSLYAAGQYSRAEQVGNQLWNIREIPEHLMMKYVTVLGRMQHLTALQGSYSQSQQFCEAMLVLLKELNKQDTPEYSIGQSNLSRLYFYQGKYRKALDILPTFVHFRENQHQTDTLLYYDYYYLGLSLVALGYNNQGMSYLEKSYVMGDSVGTMDIKYATVISLASSYYMIEQADKMKLWADSALHIAEKWKGQNSTEYAQALRVQGLYNYLQGNFDVAEQRLLKAMAIVEDNGSRDVVNMANILGGIYSLRGNYSKADSFFTIAIQKIHDLSLKQQDPSGVSELYYQYARHLMRAQRYAESKAVLQEVLALQEEFLGQDSPRFLNTRVTLDSVQTLSSKIPNP